MRTLVAAAVACLLTVGLSHADEAKASIKKTISIPAQGLGPALQTLSKERDIHVVFVSEDVGKLSTQGASGELSVDEALKVLLEGTGLTFEYLDQETVSILPVSTAPAMKISEGEKGAQKKPDFWESFRVAQATSDAVKQQSSEATDKNAAAKQANVEEVIVTGTREQGYRSDKVFGVGPWQGRSLKDTPYSVTVISEDLIKDLQATTPDQIFRITPTAQFVRPQSEIDQSLVNMRGFFVDSPYRDGLQINPGGRGTDIEDVESVELFSGLSGFLYGPGNVGGMINYISKRPTAERLNRLTLGYNDGQNYYVHGDIGGPIDSQGRFGYRVNAFWQDGETAIDNMGIDKHLISTAFDWRLTDNLLWQFDAAYRDYNVSGGQALWIMDAGVSLPSAKDIDPAVSWGQPWVDNGSKSHRYGTRLRWDANDVFTFRAAWQYGKTKYPTSWPLNFVQADGTYRQLIVGHYAPGDNSTARDTSIHSGQVFGDILFDTGVVAHKLTVGVQRYKFVQESFTRSAPTILYTGLTFDRPVYFDEPAVAHIDRGPRGKISEYTYTTALIGDDITFNEHWSLLAGIANSKIDVEPRTFLSAIDGYKKSAVVPNLSLIYKPVEAVTTYATYIESLEQSIIVPQSSPGTPPVINAGEIMDPLISEQIEIGVKWSLGRILLTTALFQIDKSLQYYDLTSRPGEAIYVQDGLQLNRGIEFTAFGKVTDHLTLIGGFTRLDAKVKEQKENPDLVGNRPEHVPNTYARLRADYRLPALPSLSLIAGVSYTSSQFGDAINSAELKVPSYTLFDAGVRYETAMGGRPLMLRLDVANLTDKAYWSWVQSLGEPRTVRFSVSADF